MRQSIFIGYRRAETRDVAGRLYDTLSLAFGENTVFKDVDSLPVGADFAKHIQGLLPKCRVFLALIGADWASARDERGALRLDDPNDLVRIEIETALATPKLLVVPVLVNGARMPSEAEVPASLRPLLLRHAAILRSDPDFKHDVGRLVQALREHLRTGRLNLEALGGAARVAANAAGLSGWAVLTGLAIAGLGVTAAVPQLRQPIMDAAVQIIQPAQQSIEGSEAPAIDADDGGSPSLKPDAADDLSEAIPDTPTPLPASTAPEDLGNGLSVVLVSLAQAQGRFNPIYVVTFEFENAQSADAGVAAEFFYHNSGYHGQMVLSDGAGGSCASDDDSGTLPTVGDNDNTFRTVPAGGRTRQTIVFHSEYCDSPINVNGAFALSGTFVIRENGARRTATVFFSDLGFARQ